jgi:hypothetical protein
MGWRPWLFTLNPSADGFRFFADIKQLAQSVRRRTAAFIFLGYEPQSYRTTLGYPAFSRLEKPQPCLPAPCVILSPSADGRRIPALRERNAETLRCTQGDK